MNDFTHGIAPGIDTPTSDNGLTTPHGQPATKITQHATKIIAVYARIKGALTGFYIYRGIGIESLVMLALVAVLALAKGVL